MKFPQKLRSRFNKCIRCIIQLIQQHAFTTLTLKIHEIKTIGETENLPYALNRDWWDCSSRWCEDHLCVTRWLRRRHGSPVLQRSLAATSLSDLVGALRTVLARRKLFPSSRWPKPLSRRQRPWESSGGEYANGVKREVPS